jgi:hypothetical protein
LAHVQRYDFLTILVTRLACALFWFNPFVWLMARETGRQQEQACDDIVLAEGAIPACYAEEVLQIAAGYGAGAFSSLAAVTMARRSTLEGRLIAILDSTQNRGSLTRGSVLATVAMVALALIPVSMLGTAQITIAPSPAAPSSTSRSAAESGPREHLDHGLVAWWRGEEDGKDVAGNHDGLFPFGIRFVPGLIGKAFDFRRSHAIAHQLQRVSIPDSADFQLSEAMTLEAWLFPREYGGVVLIRGDNRGGFDTWQVDLMTPKHVSFTFNAADNQAVGIHTPIQLGQWQHIAATFERGSMRLYVNGVLGGHTSTDLRPVVQLNLSDEPALGIGNAGGTLYSMPFDGVIDEVRIYNRALSETEIEQRLRR